MILDRSFVARALSSHAYYISSDDSTSYTSSVVIDSRQVQPGDVFIALRGEQHDGHSFVVDALERGAHTVIIDHEHQDMINALPAGQRSGVSIIGVANTYVALRDMARAWREQLEQPIVGITGSLGKTTTKELLGHILHMAGRVACVSHKNQNNDIGVPLNVLRMRQDDHVGVFEAGINAIGEMAVLADVIRPTMGVVTNVAHAHLEGLLNLPTITQEKIKLFSHFKPHHIGFIPGDQDVIAQRSFHHPVVRFGTKRSNHIQARAIKCINTVDDNRVEFMLHLYGKRAKVVLPIAHTALISNVLAAAGMAHFLDIDFATIVESIKTFVPVAGRFRELVLSRNRGVVLDDSYNACPESMKSALISFNRLEGARYKVAVIGDMLELGTREVYWHKQIGRLISRLHSIDHVVLVGPRSRYMVDALPLSLTIDLADSWQDAIDQVCRLLGENVYVLAKSSFGTGLHKLVAHLRDEDVLV